MKSALMAQFSLIPADEARELADDIRRLFDELSRALPHEHRVFSGECQPSLDVLETERAVEISVDVAGVPAEAVRVLFRGGVVLIVGEKAPPAGSSGLTYHLVERAFGRFARAVRLTGAVNAGEAKATFRDGELVIILPKISDRRGTAQRIPVTAAPEPRT
jgi:HSP20 family protein